MKFIKRKIEDQGIDMTPLVDTIIQLIIYFAVATSFAFISGMKVSLPKSGTSEVSATRQKTVVVVDQQGEIFYDNQKVDLNALRGKLDTVAKLNPDELIVIKADKGTMHGVVVTVLDLARSLGFTRLAIATDSGETGGANPPGK
jgi:biopolymer transport protein ExbD